MVAKRLAKIKLNEKISNDAAAKLILSGHVGWLERSETHRCENDRQNQIDRVLELKIKDLTKKSVILVKVLE